jgi:hypothetical protein
MKEVEAMKIAGSEITMTSQHAAFMKYEKKESLSMWVGTGRPDSQYNDAVSLSAEALHAAQEKDTAASVENNEENPPLEPKLQLLKAIIERLTGKKIILIDPATFTHDKTDKKAQEIPADETPATGQSAGYGLAYDYYESYQESESTTFSADGVINTKDGRQISFTLNLAMQREFSSEASLSIRAGDAVKKDPLVVNFDGTAAELGNTRFSFDIDADGKADSVPVVGPNSGFLALDLNGDNRINDGRELFGPKTGDGFDELACYDTDKNNWIDENDPIFDKLRIWRTSADGSESLRSLEDSGIGAIYLGRQATPFDVKDSTNNELGDVRTSGIYLTEKGVPGSIQQVDLAV